MKWIDLPPVWLLGCLGLAWLCRTQATLLGHTLQSTIGLAFVVGGIVLMLLAVWQMMQHRTTVVPHMNASSLVTSGVFGISRNPIYLGDALVLAGCILRWNAYLAIPLVPVFMYIIFIRHIRPEETRLQAAFTETFSRYCARTRRWL